MRNLLVDIPGNKPLPMEKVLGLPIFRSVTDAILKMYLEGGTEILVIVAIIETASAWNN